MISVLQIIGRSRVAGWALAVTVSMAAGACGLQQAPSGTESPQSRDEPFRNLLLIVVDTLRADHLGSYGGAADTPSLDVLAEAGVQFERAYSHIPVTAPAHSSMFTGLLPLNHGVRINTDILDSSFSTLAEVLRDNGLRTGAVVSLGVMQGKFGLDQGFELYNDELERQWHRPGREVTDAALQLMDQWPSDERFFAFVHYSDPHSPYVPPGLDYPDIRVVVDGVLVGAVPANGLGNRIPLHLAGGVTHEIRLELADDRNIQRFGFWQLNLRSRRVSLTLGTGWKVPAGSKPSKRNLTVQMPATLYAQVNGSGPVDVDLRFSADERLNLTRTRERYRLEVEYVDREIGRLLDVLESSGRLDDTVVVMTSDHGESLGDHDLLGHIHQLYNSLIRVPLIVVAPGVARQGQRVSSAVRHVDLRPTVLSLLGVEDPDPGIGVDFGQLLGGPEASQGQAHLSMTLPPLARTDLRSLIVGLHKLIRNEGTGEIELYDLELDPDELVNLASGDLDSDRKIGQMVNLLDELLLQAGSGSVREGQREPLGEDDRDMLEALGYVQ